MANGPAPQPWQVAASNTQPAKGKAPAPKPAPTGSPTGGARPPEDLLRPAADAAAVNTVPVDPKGFQTYLNAHGAQPQAGG
jgi:hypothetical protein